mgnify:CR=1 FL=1
MGNSEISNKKMIELIKLNCEYKLKEFIKILDMPSLFFRSTVVKSLKVNLKNIDNLEKCKKYAKEFKEITDAFETLCIKLEAWNTVSGHYSEVGLQHVIEKLQTFNTEE